jgi:fluoroacetyl-CoA thioesterase
MSQTELKPGLKHEVQTEVTHEKTANRISSGVVEVYATPQMIALMEQACADLAQACLPPGQTSVGTLVNVTHIAATPVGHTVRSEAELVEVDGRRLVFAVVAYDETEKIGEGRHERFIIDQERFMGRVAQKVSTAQ